MSNLKNIVEIPNVPHLRFGMEEWQYTPFGDIASKFDYGLNAEAIDFDGKHKYIRITDIDDNTSKFKYDDITTPASYDNKYLVENNDILLARTGASTGKAYLYDLNDGELYFAGFLIRVNINFGINSVFIFNQLKTQRYKKWVKIISNRSGQPGINAEEYKSYKVAICSKKTQDKIADFLTLIDRRIETQMKIIEVYKSLIKGIREQLICHNKHLGIVKKVGDVANCYGGYAFNSSFYASNGKYKIITIGNVTGEEYIDVTGVNMIHHLPKDIKPYQILKNEDILISLTGNVGRVSKVSNDNCVLNQRVAVLKPHNKELNDYLYYYLSTDTFEKAMGLCGQGAAQQNITNSDVLNYNISLSNDSQYMSQICILMKKLSFALTNCSEYLNRLKTEKRYLLDNMFI